jgi:hypothetical protein
MQKKKPRPLNPEAAKILEQYRNAGKSVPGKDGNALGPDADTGGGNSAPVVGPPPAAPMRRSGTRGK